MNEEKNRQIYESYLEATHRLGRLSCAVTLLLLLGAPFAMGAYLGAMPDLGAFGKGFASIGLVYFISCVAEYLIYVPMLGAGGSYLGGFVSGEGLFRFAGSWLPLAVALVGAGAMRLCLWARERFDAGWLDSFSIAGSMLIAMISTIFLGRLA